jgi:hypothetical protein
MKSKFQSNDSNAVDGKKRRKYTLDGRSVVFQKYESNDVLVTASAISIPEPNGKHTNEFKETSIRICNGHYGSRGLTN